MVSVGGTPTWRLYKKLIAITAKIQFHRWQLLFEEYTVEPLLTATSTNTAIFFGERSIHWLLFQPHYNGHLSTMAIFLCPQGGRCRDIQLYAPLSTPFYPECVAEKTNEDGTLTSIEVSILEYELFWMNDKTIGHFRVPKGLTIKTRLGGKPFLSHLASLWNRGLQQLGNGYYWPDSAFEFQMI